MKTPLKAESRVLLEGTSWPRMPPAFGELLRSSTCLLAWLLLVTSQRLTGDIPPLQQWGQQVRNFENAGEKRRTC